MLKYLTSDYGTYSAWYALQRISRHSNHLEVVVSLYLALGVSQKRQDENIQIYDNHDGVIFNNELAIS